MTEGKVLAAEPWQEQSQPCSHTHPGEKRQCKHQGTDTYPALALLVLMG